VGGSRGPGRASARPGVPSKLCTDAELPEIIREAQQIGRAYARAIGSDFSTGMDLAQEGLLRMLISTSRGTTVRAPRAWLRLVIRNLLADAARGRSGSPLPPLSERPGSLEQEPPADSREPSPVAAAVRNEMVALALARIEELPAPYRQSGQLQHIARWSRREIVAWLQSWRPVTEETCRRILRLTHAMLRSAGEGTDLRLRWPGRFDPRKNPWVATPPPPFRRPEGIDAEEN